MKLSIVVNNHNYERYLRNAIESALGQQGVDCEVVVVDDGSTDESRKVIDSYGNRVRAVFQDNAKQGKAISNGFEYCTGDVVMFLDADDTLYPGAAEAIVESFTSRAGVARVQWPMAVTDASGKATGELTPDPTAMATGDLSGHVLRFRTHVWPATSGAAYARSALAAVMPVPDGYDFGVDLYLAETTPFLGEVVSLPTPLSTYRRHGANVWLSREPDAEYLRQKIDWTVRTHSHVVRIARPRGFDVPEDATAALDVAFICQRLASLRLDASGHPITSDTRLRLTARGLVAAALHPHHCLVHKLKRMVWIIGVGMGSRRTAKKLVNRFYG